MRKSFNIPVWKKAPFLRLLIPVIAGILVQFYIGVTISSIFFAGISVVILLLIFAFLPGAMRFRLRIVQGFLLSLLLVFLGAALVYKQDSGNNENWYGKHKTQNSFLVATIAEPLQPKANSFKATVTADADINNGKEIKTNGKFLVYFSKDSASKKLNYGDRIIVNKVLSPIPNSGNPASFDYAQYCAFRQLYQQVFLKENEWVLLSSKKKNRLTSVIFSIREKTVEILEKYLGKNDESSIAKALLIGYKVDLDKDLVQAYSNAGVVHIIAISGLHMGIIYGVLFWIFSYLPITKKSKALRLLFLLAGLWLFALITGASPSVVRAALMFSFIIIGSGFNKKGSVYNSIAASAFFLLCYDPFLLWNVGFELSYLAVIGIVTTQKSISNWLYFENKLLQKGWQIMAVSLSAQIFTFPLCMYYFHQLPLLFLLTNLVAIPLTFLILCGCLILIVLSPVHFIALYVAKIIYALLWFLNKSVLFFDSIPYSLWTGISLSLIGTYLLYLFVSFFVFSFKQKDKKFFKISLSFLICFLLLQTFDQWKLYHQKKIIVFNISRHKAVQLIDKKNYFFIGDAEVMNDKLLNSYNLKPANIAFQLNEIPTQSPAMFLKNNFLQFYEIRFLMIDSSFISFQPGKKMQINYILISKNPRIKISDLAENFDCKNFIFDASNSSWKIEQWKKECEELHLHFHSVPEQGAFVINL